MILSDIKYSDKTNGIRFLLIIIMIGIVTIFLFFGFLWIQGGIDNKYAEKSANELITGLLSGEVAKHFKIKMPADFVLSEIISKNFKIDIVDVDVGGYYMFRVSFDDSDKIFFSMQKYPKYWRVYFYDMKQNKEKEEIMERRKRGADVPLTHSMI